MNEPDVPVQSIRTLVNASIAAAILAVILFVAVVLPAEYNIDPTGIGAGLGLTVLAAETPVVVQAQTTGEAEAGFREDEVTIEVPPRSGLEYKFHLEQYGKLTYEWSSGGTALSFDLHGEPDGNTNGYFESFAKAQNDAMTGSLTVPFAGAHGWYWRNNSETAVTVRLKTRGDYTVLGLR